MRRPKDGQLPPLKFKAPGHRSHVAGLRRFLSGRKKGWIADALDADAQAILRRLRRAESRDAQGAHHGRPPV